MAVAPAVVLMGVTGSGKSTLGKLIANSTGGSFVDADDFHPPENIAKMRRGEPLDDADRQPWLATLASLIRQRPTTRPWFLACSALKQAYRDTLLAADPDHVHFVFLDADPQVIRQRLAARHADGTHFMPPQLLDSQLATLELPADALHLNASLPPTVLARQLIAWLTRGC